MANYDQKGQNAHTQINADTVNLHINSNDSANQQSKPTYTNGFKIRVYLTINKINGGRNNKYELYIDNQVVWRIVQGYFCKFGQSHLCDLAFDYVVPSKVI